MAHFWYAKPRKVGLGLVYYCGGEGVLEFVDFYPVREMADSNQLVLLPMGKDILAHNLPRLRWDW